MSRRGGKPKPVESSIGSARWRRLSAVVLACSSAALVLGCFLIRGAVNDSPSIRWFLFSNFGASRVCPEMLKRGAPLKLSADGETIGRFFPAQCQSYIDNASQTMTLHFSGSGYAWTPVAGRVGFNCLVKVEYRPDFYLADDALYVWARTNRIVEGPQFQLLSVENPVVDWAAQGPGGYLATTFGQQIISSRLAQGFTVVRTDTGDDFAIGILQPPERPHHPFNTEEGTFVVANDTTHVRIGQVDFIGPIEVVDEDQRVHFRWRVAGTRAEALLLARSTADVWRAGLEAGAPLAPPTAPVVTQWPLELGETTHRLALPPGQYMWVIDNSDRVGTVHPAWNPLAAVGSGSLSLQYVIELVED